MPDGGDPLFMDVNAQYAGFEYHYVFQVIMGCLVWIIIPGIGLLYGGMARRKSALAMIFQSLTVIAIVTFQWMFWGFSLAFSRNGGPFIGDLSAFLLRHFMAAPSWGSNVIPDIVFCWYELLFAGCATMIVVSSLFSVGEKTY
jgi:ammonium transporter, Amt family